MNIELTGKQVDIGDRLQKHVETNVLGTVTKYFPNPIRCDVTFSLDGEDFAAEIVVHPAKNIVLKGTGTASDPYSAFDAANTHIATRLRRHKTKLNDHKSKTSLAELASESVFPFDDSKEEIDINVEAPLTIAETDANIPVCTVSDAVMLMDLSNESAILFKNSANNRISMVYRRKDGNIGWVEPKA